MEKNQSHHQAEPGQHSPQDSIGSFPKLRATVIAEVLARLLQGERLTGMHAVFASSTTRLGAYVHMLGKIGWSVESERLTVDTQDGRTTRIAEYFLAQPVIALARAAGSTEFCRSVHQARAELRGKAEAAPVHESGHAAIALAEA